MIIATVTLLTIWLTGGGGAFTMEDFRDALEETVADEERRELVVEQTKKFDEEVKNYANHVNDKAKTVSKMLRDYDTSREEIEAFITNENWRRDKLIEEVLDARFKALEVLSEDEWTATYDLAIEKAHDEDE